MATKGLESVMLRYSDGAIANGTDESAVQDSQQALENRLIHGIVMSSAIFDVHGLAIAGEEDYRLDMQVGFNSQANQPGVVATLMNTICQTVQAAITPNAFMSGNTENQTIMFPTPVRWAEGVTISMIMHIVNESASTIAGEATATLLYTD